MSIRIEVNKEVNGAGIEGRRVIKIEALKKEELPEMYIEGKGPKVWRNVHSASLHCQEKIDIWENNFYSEVEFHALLKYVQAAGENLREVNHILTEKRAAWNGSEVFII